MKKDFDSWTELKKKLEEKTEIPYFYEREVWWSCLGVNVGDEEDGKNSNFERPVLILKKFNQSVFMGCPLTTSDKTGLYYYQYKYQSKEYSVILSQAKLLSGKRLLRKVAVMPEDEFIRLKKKIRSKVFK